MVFLTYIRKKKTKEKRHTICQASDGKKIQRWVLVLKYAVLVNEPGLDLGTRANPFRPRSRRLHHIRLNHSIATFEEELGLPWGSNRFGWRLWSMLYRRSNRRSCQGYGMTCPARFTIRSPRTGSVPPF